MTTPLRGYDLTILVWHLGLIPEGVEGNPIDDFRITDPLTGVSVDWCPHLDVQQARQIFWDLLPRSMIDVCGDKALRRQPDRVIGFYQTHDARLDEVATVDWSATDPDCFTEAEGLLWAAAQAILAQQQ